jgi:hypothetical protein
MNQQQLMNRVVSAAIWQLMRRAPTWLLVVIVGGAFLVAFAHGGTLICTDWQGTRTCQGDHGYISRESTWQGRTTGSDNRGNAWSAYRWQDRTIIEERHR